MKRTPRYVHVLTVLLPCGFQT